MKEYHRQKRKKKENNVKKTCLYWRRIVQAEEKDERKHRTENVLIVGKNDKGRRERRKPRKHSPSLVSLTSTTVEAINLYCGQIEKKRKRESDRQEVRPSDVLLPYLNNHEGSLFIVWIETAWNKEGENQEIFQLFSSAQPKRYTRS